MADAEDSFKAPELSLANFDSTLKSGRDAIWLVDFFAPWCGHCKRLSPVWDKAAEESANQNLPVKFVKVDCTANSALCKRYGVSSYPKLKVLASDGSETRKFRGARSVDGLLDYARRLAAAPVKDLQTSKELKDFIEGNLAAFVLFTPAESQDGYPALERAFRSAAEELYDVAALATAPEYTGDDLGIKVMHDGKTISGDDGFGGKLLVFRQGEGKQLSSHVNITTDAISHWINGHRSKMMNKIDHNNYNDLGDRNKPLVISGLRGKSPRPGAKEGEPEQDDNFEEVPINAEFLGTMKAVAKELEDKFTFGYLDGKRWQQFVVKYGITGRVLPRILVMETVTERHRPVPVDVKGHRGIVDYLELINAGNVTLTRTWERLYRDTTREYMWHIIAGFVGLVVLVLGWSIHSDYKRAAAKKDVDKSD